MIPPTGGSRRAPHGTNRAPGCRALAQRPSRALIVWFGCAESAGAPPRAHIQSEAVRVGISASPAKRCTDFVHATTICTDYNTNFTHFEAAACCFAVAASHLRPGHVRTLRERTTSSFCGRPCPELELRQSAVQLNLQIRVQRRSIF